MNIVGGDRLGPYQITSRIGAGGMGEVWRAVDTRLNREVAVKVLPDSLAADPARKLRLTREARAISQLSHPHICALYDVGDDYLVMELLQGDTLASRLHRGALPLREVLRYGMEIADALAHAHKSGIAHRDLKPANIMITPSGAKLLDFGLARMDPTAATGDDVTEARALTAEGAVLGTLHYMAPEQFEGQKADHRSDIFSLGVVLYEMVTGKPAFSASSRAGVISAIAGGEAPPMDGSIPPLLQQLISRCLEKNPDARWQSAYDIARQLEWMSGGSPAATASPGRKWRHLRWSLPVLIIITAGTWMAARWSRDNSDTRREVVRFSLPLLAGDQLTGGGSLAVSPDGKRFVYAIRREGKSRIYLRSFDRSGDALLFEGGGELQPFFSPDGKWVGFYGDGALRRISVRGGLPQTICAITSAAARGATWAQDGMIYFAPTAASGLWRVPAAGGTPSPVTTPDATAGENSHRWPQAMPDGRHLIFAIRTDRITSFDQARIALLDLRTRRWVTLLDGGTYPRYLSSGHLLFGRANAIYAAPFDLDAKRVTGEAVRVVDGVVVVPQNGAADYAVGAGKGSLVYIPGTAPSNRRPLLRVDRGGHTTEIDVIGSGGDLRVSPDGRRVALWVAAANDDVHVVDLERATMTRLSFERGDKRLPVWSADGEQVFFAARAEKSIFARAANGGGSAELVTKCRDERCGPYSTSPDGNLLAFVDVDPVTRFDVWLKPLGGERPARPFLQTPFSEHSPLISPDARWIAYVSDETGSEEVYLRSLAGSGGRWRLSTEGGTSPRWSKNGRELFFRKESEIYAVAVGNADQRHFGQPRRLFKLPGIAEYDVLDDGFLAMTSWGETAIATNINVVLNWSEELKGPR